MGLGRPAEEERTPSALPAPILTSGGHWTGTLMHDSLFARAKRGDLPHELHFEDIARLSSASLDAQNGQCPNDAPLLRRLYGLLGAGLLVPVRSEQVPAPGRVFGSFGGQRVGAAPTTTTRHFVRAEDLRAHLADLGEVGPLLANWIGAPRAVEEVAPRARDGAEAWHVPVVHGFCEAVIASGEIDEDSPGVTAADISAAMLELRLWHREEGDLPSAASRERYVRATAGKHFVLQAGRPKDCPNPEERHMRAVAHLVELYNRVKPETMTRIDPESASNFQGRKVV